MKILLIGESFTDEYVYGTCDRICSEAPAICFKSDGHTTQNQGMAANVLSNLNSLHPSLQVDLITNKSTIIKRRFIDTKYNTIVFREDHKDFCDNFVQADFTDDFFIGYDAIVFSDYCKGFISEEDIEYICSQSDPKTPKFIDTKKRLGSFIKYFDFIKINEHEFENNYPRKIRRFKERDPYTGEERELSTTFDPESILWSCKNLIVTRGERGAMHFSKGSHISHKYDTLPVPENVKDVCGAGDTFLAAFVIKYLESQDIPTSINWANQCAGKVVRKFGVATP